MENESCIVTEHLCCCEKGVCSVLLLRRILLVLLLLRRLLELLILLEASSPTTALLTISSPVLLAAVVSSSSASASATTPTAAPSTTASRVATSLRSWRSNSRFRWRGWRGIEDVSRHCCSDCGGWSAWRGRLKLEGAQSFFGQGRAPTRPGSACLADSAGRRCRMIFERARKRHRSPSSTHPKHPQHLPSKCFPQPSCFRECVFGPGPRVALTARAEPPADPAPSAPTTTTACARDSRLPAPAARTSSRTP